MTSIEGVITLTLRFRQKSYLLVTPLEEIALYPNTLTLVWLVKKAMPGYFVRILLRSNKKVHKYFQQNNT